MKKKALTAALLSAVLLSTLAGASIDKCSAANLSITVDVITPENGGIYDSTNVTLKIGVFMRYESHPDWYILYSVEYRVDGDVYKHVVLRGSVAGLFSFSYDLVGLSEGRHSLEVTVEGSVGNIGQTVSSGRIYFTVDLTAPKVKFVSSQQQTFGSGADATFNFTVFEGVSWLGYSLDGGSVVTVTDNVTSTISHRLYNYQLTLADLSDGAHSLTVYAEDLVGNTGTSEPLQFTVGQETQREPEQPASEQPFPTALIATASASAATVGIIAGILLYIKRNKRKPAQTQAK